MGESVAVSRGLTPGCFSAASELHLDNQKIRGAIVRPHKAGFDLRAWNDERSIGMEQNKTSALPDPRRAIYIDFEGNKDSAPTLIGVLWPSGDFEQLVFEEAFASAALAKGLSLSSLPIIIEEIVSHAERNDLEVVAWSRHELDVVKASTSLDLAARFESRHRDAKKLAKKWLHAVHPGVVPPQKPHQLGKHSLAFYVELTGYKVPKAHGPL